MKRIKILKVVIILGLISILNLACSGSDVAKKIVGDLTPNTSGQSLSNPDISGSYISSCIEDVWGVNFRIIQMDIDEDNLTYTQSEYQDSGCLYRLDDDYIETLVGTLEVREELDGENGFFYQFLIPIDDNASAVKLINIKQVDEEEINVSDFYYFDEDFSLEENSPEILLFK